MYPDFIVQLEERQLESPIASVLVVESKGKHLCGSDDTNDKRAVATTFGEIGKSVSWQKLGGLR